MSRTRIGFMLLALTVVASNALATSTGNVGPLAKADAISISLLIGDSLALDHYSNTSSLFEGREREEQFRTDLVASVTARLQGAGIAVSDKATDYLLLSFFGGGFEKSESGPVLVFVFEASVSKESIPEYGCHSRVVLGTTRDQSLDHDLRTAALKVVDEFIQQRERYRESNGGAP